MSGTSPGAVYVCERWEIDLGRRELRAQGTPVPLSSRAFEIVEVLVRSAQDLVTKDQLFELVWPGVVVGEGTLHVHISAIRKALGADRGLLKTASGRGYRLLGNWTPRHQGSGTAPTAAQTSRVAGTSQAHNFPRIVTPLIGRATAAHHVRDLVSAYRVVTLTGPGGIGKTTLALKAARHLLADFDGGAWLVELASLSDPGLVPSAVASALELKLGFDEISAESVARAVGETRRLIVLDNCEHVIDVVANLAETLVRLCARTTILATSREILRIDGEIVYRVPPLEVPAPARDDADHILNHSAVELFVTRTRALDAGFSPRADELPSIGAICRHLDGIPLAIEFAAAHASVFGIQTMAARLHDRFALLIRGRRTALPRHRTLRAMLDWSYELLSEAERLLLRHLAIFSGGFTVEAAAAMVSDGFVDSFSVLEGIANLVAKSLVAPDRATTSRWYLLETIRVYALEKLSGHGERDTAARRHATYFRDLFSRSAWVSSSSVSADERTSRVREIDNVRAALDWCFSVGGDRVLGVDLVAGYSVWFRADVGTTMVDTAQGARQSLDLLTRALDTAETLDDLRAQERVLVAIIIHHSFSAKHDRTLAAAERLLHVADRIGDAAVSRNAERLMGNALVMVGRPRKAQGFLQRSLNVERSMPDQSRSTRYSLEVRALARAFLSRTLWLQGFIDQARLEAQSSLDELPVTDHSFVLCRVLYYGVCRIMPTTGDFAAAEQSIARLIEAATRIDAPFWQTAGRFLSGELMIERGEFVQGVAVLNDAFDACRRTGWRMWYPEFKGALATGLAGLGQLDEALTAVNEGLDDVVQGEHGHDLFFADLLRIKGDILLRCGAVAAAEDSLRDALDIAQKQEALLWELRAAVNLARVRIEQGRGGEASQFLAQIYDRFTEGFETPDLRAAKALLTNLRW